MKNILLVLFILFLFSCTNKQKAPEHVIPKEDMIEIIIDMHLTDGLFTVSKVRRNLTKKDSINYYEEIFSNYGYTREDFDTSVHYYIENINEYDLIYQEVLNRLNEMETVLQQESKKDADEKRKQKEEDEKPEKIDDK